MSNVDIAIVGLGQFGERHLQSILDSKFRISLWILEKNVFRLKSIEKKYTSNTRVELNFISDVAKIPPKLNIAIISTTAETRLKALSDIMNTCNVEYLIIEKILTNNTNEIKDFNELCNQHKDIYINFSRREMLFHKKIRDIINIDDPEEIVIKGKKWDLASNSFHYIDLVEWYFDKKVDNVKVEVNKSLWIDSKRSNFFELNGKIRANFNDGLKLCLISEYSKSREDAIHPTIDIKMDNKSILIDEANNRITINGKCYIFEFGLELQSKLTMRVLENMLFNGVSELPKLQSVIETQRIILDSINGFWKTSDLSKFSEFPRIT